MKKFTDSDLSRIKSMMSEYQASSLIRDIIDLTDAHKELLVRYRNIKQKKEMYGRQLNHVNNKLRELKKANATLTAKSAKVGGIDLGELLLSLLERRPTDPGMNTIPMFDEPQVYGGEGGLPVDGCCEEPSAEESSGKSLNELVTNINDGKKRKK
jgi:hypothetical protein